MLFAAALLATSLLAPSAAAALPLDPAASCQLAVDQARRFYPKSRLADARAGRRSSRKAQRVVRVVERVCDGVVAGPELPRFGPPCDTRITPGEPLPAHTLALCLRATLEREVAESLPEPPRPNVVIVLTDDQRPETLAFMPRLQRLSEEGVQFTNAFATSSLCTPSRASLYSGLYAHHHGSTTNQQDFDDADTLAPWLADAGYETGLFGKYRNDVRPDGWVAPGWSEWQVFSRAAGTPPDCPPNECPYAGYFDYTLNENGTLVAYGDAPEDYSTDLLAERVVDFVRDNAERPFLAVFAPYANHVPATPAPRHRGSLADVLPWRPPGWGPRADDDVPNWVRFLHFLFTPELAAAIDARRIGELESLQAVDEALGMLLAELERLGLTDQTLLVFTSDQGIHWGEQGWGSKGTAYEPAIRVPLIVRYPVAAPLPDRRDELVLNIDLAPTIAEAGAATTAPMDGSSLLPLLAGPAPWRGSFLIENDDGLIVRAHTAVRTSRWKYIETPQPGGVFLELYDLANDPGETVNLASDPEYRIVRAILAQRLAELRAP